MIPAERIADGVTLYAGEALAVLVERDPGHCETIRRRVYRADVREPGTLFSPDLFGGVT